MARLALMVFVLLTASSMAHAAPFCALVGGVAQCYYYDMQSCRAAAGSGGTCFVNPDVPRSGFDSPRQRPFEPARVNPAIEAYNERVRAGDAARRAEQESFERRRQGELQQRREAQEAELRQLEIERRRRELAQ